MNSGLTPSRREDSPNRRVAPRSPVATAMYLHSLLRNPNSTVAAPRESEDKYYSTPETGKHV